jgi:Sel1 repeat
MRILTFILCLLSVSAFAEITPEQFKKTKELAEKGGSLAQFNLGLCYDLGDGVPKDLVQAAKWYRKSAEQGNLNAQCALGNSYFRGEGVLKDSVEAVKWFRKAAEQGDEYAQSSLGLCYYEGDGVLKDTVEAYAYFNLAGITSEKVRGCRDTLEKKMTPSQIEAGQKRSKELLAIVEANKKANSK